MTELDHRPCGLVLGHNTDKSFKCRFKGVQGYHLIPVPAPQTLTVVISAMIDI